MCKIGPQWHLTWQAYLESSSQETHIKAQLCLSPEHLFCLCRYKKNIKALYIVHPTMFIKTLLILFTLGKDQVEVWYHKHKHVALTVVQ